MCFWCMYDAYIHDAAEILWPTDGPTKKPILEVGCTHDACIQDAFLHDACIHGAYLWSLILMHVCMMHISMIHDLNYDGYIYDFLPWPLCIYARINDTYNRTQTNQIQPNQTNNPTNSTYLTKLKMWKC